MKYAIIPVTPFQQNCTLLWCEASAQAAIADPGGDVDRILAEIETRDVEPVKILLTHAHLDHVGGAAELAAKFDLPIEGPHRDDRPWLDALDRQSEIFGLPPPLRFTPDRWLEQDDLVGFGEQRLQVIHCPGHTPGHVVFFHQRERLALVGDVLFQGSIGRTDFPGGDHPTLLHSIRERLWSLGDDVRFIPGHGPMSSFGEERRSNPFVRDR